MTGWDGKTFWAEYGRFSVGPESGNYTLTVGDYGTTSKVSDDEMAQHNGMMFSTYDRDNDNSNRNCASVNKGGWWYTDCHDTNPTGVYLSGGVCDGTGMHWFAHPKCSTYSFKIMTFTLIPK